VKQLKTVLLIRLLCRKKILRERLGYARVRNRCDQLLPHEGAETEEDAPDPLLEVEGRRGKGPTTKLDDENLEKNDFENFRSSFQTRTGSRRRSRPETWSLSYTEILK